MLTFIHTCVRFVRCFLWLMIAVIGILTTNVSVVSSYTVLNQEPSSQLAYPNSLWTKPLPSDIMSHLASNSGVVAPTLIDSNDSGGSPLAEALWGRTLVATPGYDDLMRPRYYGNASDPLYTITGCSNTPGSGTSPIGMSFHIPSGACFSGGYADAFFQVWDQVSNKTLSIYGPYGTNTCLPSCSGSCNIGSSIASYCGAGDYTTGPATGWNSAASLGSGAFAVDVRSKEWMDGVINHPLYIYSTCTVGHIFPSPGDTYQCANLVPSNNGAKRPPQGALVFFDYTDAQINAMNLPAWQKPLVRAMSRYGAYIGDTTANYTQTMSLATESSQAWVQAGQTNPLYAWLASQGIGCLGNSPPGSSCRYDMRWLANIPLVNGTDVRSHIHMAAECVALGLANQPGGCTSPDSPPGPATTYYVATNGSDGNSCGSAQSVITPKLTVTAGIACLSGGDILIVKAGTYHATIDVSSVPNGFSERSTIIKSDVLHGAVMQPNSGSTAIAAFTGNKQWITLDGFVFDGTNMSVGGGGLSVNAQAGAMNILVQNIEIRNIKGDATNNEQNYIPTAAITASWSTANTIFRNINAHDIGFNQTPGTSCNSCYSSGVDLSGTGYLLESSQFVNVSGYAVIGYASGTPGASNDIIRGNYFENTGGALFMCQRDNQIYNNILNRVGIGAGGTQHQRGIQTAGSCSNQPSTNNFIANNTVYGSAGACIDLGYGNTNIVRNNICYSNAPDSVVNGTGGPNTVDHNLLGTNPLVVSAVGGNFHLTSSSPARSLGLNLSGMFTTDYDAISRSSSGTWDAGALTFTADLPPTKLAFNIQPQQTVVSVPMATITVQVQNVNGDLMSGDTSSVTLATTGVHGGVAVNGTTTKAAVGGVATFTGLNIAVVNTNYQLLATASGLTSATSSSFDITNPPVSQLSPPSVLRGRWK